MIGQYLNRSRFWKNVLALMPELTEKKLPKKSLLQIIPSSDSVNISKAQTSQTIATQLSSAKRIHWPSLLSPITLPAMGSLETNTENDFEPISLKEFEAVFPRLVEDLSQHSKQYGLPDDALKWYQDVSRPLRTTFASFIVSPSLSMLLNGMSKH